MKKDHIDCALERKPADLVISNVTVFHLTDGTTEHCDVAVYDGKIAGLGSYTQAEKFIDGSGLYAVPGFIDSHVHLESSHLLPQNYEKLVLPHGVTTAFCDPHELANVAGEKAFEFFFDAAQKLDMSLRVNLSSCVPATTLETAGAEITASVIEKWHKLHPETSLAELMNIPGLLNGDPEVLAKAELFDRIDGHCPLITGKELNACAAAGVVNCHESASFTEAAEKLRRGLLVLIREGSAAKVLDELTPLITVANSPLIAFCTDDRSPLEIINEGHIDSMIRRAIASGADPLAVYRASSWSPAAHYGLHDRGLIAPGKRADIVLLSDLKNCTIKNVLVKGKEISSLTEKSIPLPPQLLNTVKRTAASAKAVRSLCASVFGKEAYKVTAARSCPARDTARAKLGLKGVKHDFKLGSKDCRVLLHMLHNALGVAEILNVTKLIYLIKADSLRVHNRLNLLHIVCVSRKNSQARTGISDLRGRCKVKNSVLCSVLTAYCEDVR